MQFVERKVVALEKTQRVLRKMARSLPRSEANVPPVPENRIRKDIFYLLLSKDGKDQHK